MCHQFAPPSFTQLRPHTVAVLSQIRRAVTGFFKSAAPRPDRNLFRMRERLGLFPDRNAVCIIAQQQKRRKNDLLKRTESSASAI